MRSVVAQDNPRKQVIANNLNAVVGDVAKIAAAPNPSEVQLQNSEANLIVAVDSAFNQLKSQNLNQGKMQHYEVYWNHLKRDRLNQADNAQKKTLLLSFAANFYRAADDTGCTVSVSASKGFGAAIRCAKAADAATGPFLDLGLTTVQADIEKASYVFIAIRNGQETGRAQKDCTGARQSVEIVEN
jgi:hypothetical protein